MTARDVLDGIRVRARAYTEHGTPGLAAPRDRAGLLAAVDAVLAYGADREKYTDTGDPKVDAAIRSYAYHMERIITEALGESQ